jgi:nucleotidyltransferase/DNA polymerase involved in DNA repair
LPKPSGRRIFEELGITVSIGVADNKVFAKLGSDLKKPNAVTVVSPDNFAAWRGRCLHGICFTSAAPTQKS